MMMIYKITNLLTKLPTYLVSKIVGKLIFVV